MREISRMPTSFKIFIGCWIALGIATSAFYSKASYETKKAFHPFIVSTTGVVFLGFTESLMRGRMPWFFILAVVGIIYLNIRNTQFCPKCSATLCAGFRRLSFCPKCGTDLRA
jgi:hypothetical protein